MWDTRSAAFLNFFFFKPHSLKFRRLVKFETTQRITHFSWGYNLRRNLMIKKKTQKPEVCVFEFAGWNCGMGWVRGPSKAQTEDSRRNAGS